MKVTVSSKDVEIVTTLKINELQEKKTNGGGGIRTPVPRYFRPGVYMHSRLFKSRIIARQTTGSQINQSAISFAFASRTTRSAIPLFVAHC